jgi:hypothetical protein
MRLRNLGFVVLLLGVLIVGALSASQASVPNQIMVSDDADLLVPDCNCTVFNCTGPGTQCHGYRPEGGECDAVACGAAEQ